MKLADDIIKTFTIVDKACREIQEEENDEEGDEEEMKNILNLPLPEKYRILL